MSLLFLIVQKHLCVTDFIFIKFYFRKCRNPKKLKLQKKRKKILRKKWLLLKTSKKKSAVFLRPNSWMWFLPALLKMMPLTFILNRRKIISASAFVLMGFYTM